MKRIMCEDQRVKQLITVVQLRENVHAQLLINKIYAADFALLGYRMR